MTTERQLTVFSLFPAAHEVERNVERIDIAVVGVVDEDATVLALFHLKAHGDRLQVTHAGGYLVRSESQAEGNHEGRDGIVDRSLIDERNLILMRLALIYISNVAIGAFYLGFRHEHMGFLVVARPV